MKWQTTILSLLIFAEAGYMSGMSQEVELKSRLHAHNPVYAVTILGSSSVKIKELKEATQNGDSTVADKEYYIAKIVEIINPGEVFTDNEQPWTMLFTPKENAVVKKMKTSGIDSIAVKDTVFIMDYEDLLYTYMYYVEGRHKIFYYYQCPDVASPIKTGTTYLFIAGTSFSKKNPVLYGNIDYGLYPDTKTMRRKIADILSGRNDTADAHR